MRLCFRLRCVCVNLVFFQGDLAHLSVANKRACHLVDRLSCSHSDDVVGRYEAGSLPDLPLVEQKASTFGCYSMNIEAVSSRMTEWNNVMS